jgi:hypothetical protein
MASTPANDSPTIENTTRSAKVRRMFGLDLHGWEQAMLWFLGIVAIGGVGVVIATYSVIKLQREESVTAKADLAKNQAQTTKEIAAANAVAETAKKDAAAAHERTALAELALERLKSPRTLGPERQAFVASAVRPFAGQRYEVAISQGADDGLAFWESLYVTLERAGWVYVRLAPNQPGMGNPAAGIPLAAIPGVEIRFDPAKEAEMTPPALALGNALHADGTVVAVNRDTHTSLNADQQTILQVIIGARVPPP